MSAPALISAPACSMERLKTPQVKTGNWDGAARQKVRPVEELRAAKVKLAAAEGHSLGTKITG